MRTLKSRFSANFALLLSNLRGRRRRTVGRVRWGIFAFVVLCLSAVALAVLDAPVGAYRKQWPAGLTAIARSVTDIGQTHWYLVPSGVFLIAMLFFDWSRLDRRRKWLLAHWYCLSGYVFITIAASGLVATLLKRIIGRARPKYFQEHGPLAFDGFATDAGFASFPSGHATAVGALAAILALLFPRARLVVLLVAVLLGSTRILVGAHYPSDVIAGLAFGMWFAYFTAVVFAARGFIFSVSPGSLPVVRPSFGRFLSQVFANVPFLQRRRTN